MCVHRFNLLQRHGATIANQIANMAAGLGWPWMAWPAMANDGLQRSAMDRSTFLFSVTSSAGQLWPAEAKFGQPRLAKAVLDLIHEFHLCHQPDVMELPAS